MTVTEIASQIGCSKRTVRDQSLKLLSAGLIDRNEQRKYIKFDDPDYFIWYTEWLCGDALKANGANLKSADMNKTIKVKVTKAPAIILRDKAPKFANPQVILSKVDINKGNKQVAHGIDGVLLPFAP